MHYLSSSYDGMIMPRSWIIRALMRQSSYWQNGSMPHVLVPVLGSFLEKLVGKTDSGKHEAHNVRRHRRPLRWLTVGKMQHRGNSLWQSGPPIAAILRVCRCLSLREYPSTLIHICSSSIPFATSQLESITRSCRKMCCMLYSR